MKKHSIQFLKLVEQAKSRITETTVAATAQKLQLGDAFHLIDVREKSEWDEGHIPNAVHLSKGILERDIEKQIPNLNDEIILYCGGGFRSAIAAENLNRMGYTAVRSMKEGWQGWKNAKLPIERNIELTLSQ